MQVTVEHAVHPVLECSLNLMQRHEHAQVEVQREVEAHAAVV